MRSEGQAVSVVMPVRNAMPFLDAAITSILAQTHGNFELLIGDDGSTDGSTECIAQWAARDARIRVIRNDGNGLGPSGSSNWVARAAKHDLIARMDADDISHPDRLRRQLLALQANPDAVMIGSLCEVIDSEGKQVFGLNRRMLRKIGNICPASHGSLMLRREAFELAGGYRAASDYWEDHDLMLRMMRQGQAILLVEPLFQYRLSPTSSRLVADEMRVTRAVDLGMRCLARHCDGGSYEAIIEADAKLGPPARVTFMTVERLAYDRLWRGDTRTIRSAWGRQHADIPWSPGGIAFRLFETWAMLSPASLRRLIRLRARFGDWGARKLVGKDEMLVWTDAKTGWQRTPFPAAGEGMTTDGTSPAKPSSKADLAAQLV